MRRFDPSTPAPTSLLLMSQRCAADQDCTPCWVDYRMPGDATRRVHFASVPDAVAQVIDEPDYITAHVREGGQLIAVLARRKDGTAGFAYPGLPL